MKREDADVAGEGAGPVRPDLMPDRVFEHSVALLEDLCRISSASGDVPGVERMARRLGGHLEEAGLETSLETAVDVDGLEQPVLTARGPAAGAEGYLLLVGHLDTVLPAIAPSLAGGRLVGTGALDMKGGFAAFIGAMALLRDIGESPPDDLLLIAVPDEEVGGRISEEAVRSWGSAARAVLVLEPGELRGDAETLVTGRRGLVGWRLEARGRAAHSGLAYWQGRSALAAAARWCGEVQLLSERGEGPTVNVGRIIGGDAEFVDELPEHHSLVGTNYRLNVVSDRCVAEGEVRYLCEGDHERILEKMREIAERVGREAEVDMLFEVFETIAPVDPSGPGGELAHRLVGVADGHGWRLELEHDRGGVSFPNFLPDPTAIPVLDGLGPVGGGMHTREEFLDLRSLRRRIALQAELLRMMGGR